MQVRFGHSRLSALLASSSVAALLIGGGAPSAFAQCAISPGTNQSSVSNSAAINCININGITVTGNVTNTGTGTITATGATAPTRTGITINNASVGGAIVNAGTISAPGGGISISNVAQFGSAGGGISNSGTITAGGGAISLSNVTSFYGGIVNAGTGTISGVRAIDVEFGSLFAGGINNSGTLTTGSTALRISGISTFQGGITNSGTISGTAGILVSNGSTFAGGITNSGTIAASVASGISVNGISVFSGGISNSGTISAGAAGIYVSGVATFAGGVTNSGAITGNPGVNFGGSGSLTNLATGVITSGFNLGDGVDAAGILTLTNAGTISSGSGNIAHASYGVAANGGGTIVNSGSITGHWSGIDVHNTAVSVTNSGTITGNRFGGIEISDGVAGTSTINNNNNGLIQGLTGEGYGLLLGSSANIINNVGATIAGAQDIAIYVRDSAVLTALTNAGAVSGLSWAILIQAGNSQITNMSTGVISASGAGSTAIEIDSGDAAISNAGTISGSTTAINVSNATGHHRSERRHDERRDLAVGERRRAQHQWRHHRRQHRRLGLKRHGELPDWRDLYRHQHLHAYQSGQHQFRHDAGA